MHSIRRLILSLIAALVLLTSACGDDSADRTTTTGESTTTTGAETTTTTAGTTSTTATDETTTSLVTPPTDGEAGDLEDEVNALTAVVEEIRGLRFISQPGTTVLTAEEMGERIRADIEEELDPEEIALEEALYELLGMLDGSIDLASALADLYAEQVVGRYLHETNELLVLGGSELTPMTRWIIFHELIHALVEQHFRLGEVLEELASAERYHEARALQSLMEGDATYFQIVYLQQMSTEDQVAIAAEMLSIESPVAGALPGWLTDDLTFPYEYGFSFVERIVAEQGIAGVDQAYRLTPDTVEQIMHPEKYFVFEPAVDVLLPDDTPPGYEVGLDGTFGEWNLRLFLAEALGDGEAVVAASGWGGDYFRILSSGDEVVFAYLFEGDTPRDAEELEAALADAVTVQMAVGGAGIADDELGATTFSGSDFAFIQRVGVSVLFVAASDPPAGRTVSESLRLTPPTDS